MKKEQLIHLHELLVQIKDHMKNEGMTSEEAHEKIQEEYDKLGMKPDFIHRGKKDHQESVQLLSRTIAERVEELDDYDNRLEDNIQKK